MSHIRPEAILGDPVGTTKILLEIAWRLPMRASLSLWKTLVDGGKQVPKTSMRIAIATSVFAPALAYNWHLVLARPRFVDDNTGLLFPEDIEQEEQDKDHIHGFHGYLYVGPKSPFFGKRTLRGADAVWIHAHGGGFYAGEARQYHHTYMRWIDKASKEVDMDLRILAVEYPLSTIKPYPACVDAVYAAYKHVLAAGVPASRVFIAGDSAGGNAAISTCYKIIEDKSCPSPAGVIMLSPWMDLTRSTSGHSPNQPTDWLTTFDSEECRKGAIEVYMGSTIKSAADPRVSPLFRTPAKALPKQFLSAGTAEVLFADAKKWAEKVKESLGEDSIECHFAKDQVHTFAVGGWLADPDALQVSDWRILSFLRGQISTMAK